MPYARISLLKGKSPDYLRAISAGLQRALEESFDVPPHDCFQVFEQLEPLELVFDRHYLGGPRSDDFMLIAITAGKPRDTATKKAFYKRLAHLLGHSPGIDSEDIMIAINTTQRDEWSFGGGRASMVEQADEGLCP
jgi:phenylpyruvate tautomerase PptA (4-oxalocrotonate tautomerase family)